METVMQVLAILLAVAALVAGIGLPLWLRRSPQKPADKSRDDDAAT